MNKISRRQHGFALPTVLIASVVMLTVLAVAVSSVAAVRVTLKQQYYEQLAKTAGEAGVAYAKACLAKNGNVPQWSDVRPLTPSTDCYGNQLLAPQLDTVLVVAGGGSGGGSTGGGGGGGGVISTNDVPLSNGTYSVVVGSGGGATGNQLIGNNGGNSSFNGMTAIGGGGGAHTSSGCAAVTSGLAGGSGGGAQTYCTGTSPGAGTAGQGTSGGNYSVDNDGTTGGGGAGGTGLATTVTSGGGAGGPGKLSTITGSSVWYGGGGGGGDGTGATPAGGVGGGGRGGGSGVSGVQGTGGGGGGGWSYATGTGGAGGSGVVILRYGNNGSVTATGGTVTTSGPYKIHTFTSSGNFTVTATNVSSCPTDPRCSVMVDDGVRSTFSVGLPTVDASGKAVAIPNNGYVELVRESNGVVWRTYKQPSMQAAVTPDLCSGSASTGLGWKNAVRTTEQDALPGAPSAITISESDSAMNIGLVYFRKDFAVSEAGNYKIGASTPTGSESMTVYIDGVSKAYASNSYQSSADFFLSAGCHTITGVMVNGGILPRESRFTFALQKTGASVPIVTSDSSWRVSAGETRHFSESDYEASNTYWWPPVYDRGLSMPNYDTSAITGDWAARKIGPNVSGTGAPPSYPVGYLYVRDSKDIEVDQNTNVEVSAVCDDDCVVYMDGVPLINSSVGSTLTQASVTLTPGKHRFGARIYNASAGPAGLAMSVVRTSDNAVMTRTDRTWQGANLIDTVPAMYYSYSKSFVPSPDEVPRTVQGSILVAAGGGGGANTGSGGGAGGVIYNEAYTMTPGTYAVTIGGGGAGGVGSGVHGAQGGNTVFGSLTAIGGGAGVSHGGYTGGSGGSGGGASIATAATGGVGGVAYSGGAQGRDGGGMYIDVGWAGNSGGGGGYGSIGANGGNTTYTGHGGAGFPLTITGSPFTYAAGGGAGEVVGSYVGRGDSGAGAGVLDAAGTSAVANTGSGGGGGSYTGSYFNGGNGGSGVVVIRYKTGTVTATGGTITTWNGYTIHRFTSNGTFEITAVTP